MGSVLLRPCGCVENQNCLCTLNFGILKHLASMFNVKVTQYARQEYTVAVHIPHMQFIVADFLETLLASLCSPLNHS